MKIWDYASLNAVSAAEVHSQSDAMEPRMDAILSGKHPAAQGAVLGLEVAKWLAGLPEEHRKDALANMVDLIEKLVPPYAEEIWARYRSMN